ncbi:MAG TPA: hypothetical protein VM692_17015 [Gammaproteobacteria bacterium]|nr:hypothetical protein [Gammaproteobacteria bacterium]
MNAALRALTHFETYRSRAAAIDARIACGQVWRDADRSERDWAVDATTGVALLVNGAVFSVGPIARRIDARRLLEGYLTAGALAPRELDGAFQILLADPRKGSVFLYNDRLGTLPAYYGRHNGVVCVAPEAKAVFAALSLQPQLATAGIVSFLSCGYCLGSTTLFAGVSFLEPGSSLEIAVASGEIAVQRYWKMQYRSARALRSRAAAESALHGAIARAHEVLVGDSERGFDLMLSGGWDSRGILAYLHSLGRMPSTGVSWGLTKDIPQSDPFIASQLAQRFAVPFKFVSYDSDEFVANARNWCYLSELANDNIGWYAEGASVLAGQYHTAADFTLVGDESWGWHGHPRTEQDARNACMPASPGAQTLACLSPGIRDESRARYEADVTRVLAACDNEHPADRRDFLYLHGRVARFIFALGYYKEFATEVRRPFLLGNVLDVLAEVPARFRADKNLYISMLGRFFPEVAAFPSRAADSLPDWTRDIRAKPELRNLFLDLLDERSMGGTLGTVLDGASVEKLKNTFFAGNAASKPAAGKRSLVARLPLRMRQRLRASGLYPGSTNMAGAYASRGAATLVRCIALLSLLQRSLPAFAARAAP